MACTTHLPLEGGLVHERPVQSWFQLDRNGEGGLTPKYRYYGSCLFLFLILIHFNAYIYLHFCLKFM